MQVSVITAVRNGVGEIEETLNSVAAQSYRDVEHVIVDGASSDGTAEIVRGRKCVSISEPDNGVYDAFNKGLAIASGNVIAFLGAGDVYADPDAISRVVSALHRENVRAAFGDVLITDGVNSGRALRRYRSKSFSPQRLRAGFMPAHPTLFMSREVYDRIGYYKTTYRIAGDFELCVRAFLLERVSYTYLPEVLVRMRSGGLSNRGWRSSWVITEEMQRACRENGVSTSLPRLLWRLPAKVIEMLSRGN